MKKILSLVLAVVLAFSTMLILSGCATKTDLEKIKSDKVLNVGMTIYEPMDYYDTDGKTIIGFDAELAEAFAKTLGVKVNFIEIKWANKVIELNSKSIDLIWNGMTASDELGTQIDFSTAYATNYQCVVVKNDIDSYVNADSLKTKKVAVEQSSAGDTVITDLGITPTRLKAQLDALTEVKSGTSDCAVIDYTMAYNVVGKGDFADLKIVDAAKISFENEVFAVGARKGSDITASLNAFLKAYYESGEMAKLAEKYGVAINDAAFGK